MVGCAKRSEGRLYPLGGPSKHFGFAREEGRCFACELEGASTQLAKQAEVRGAHRTRVTMESRTGWAERFACCPLLQKRNSQQRKPKATRFAFAPPYGKQAKQPAVAFKQVQVRAPILTADLPSHHRQTA